MSKEFEVDKRELVKQIEEKIYKGEHTELKILIGAGSHDPVCSLVNKGTTHKEMVLLYLCLESTKEMIEKKYPLAVMYAKKCLKLDGRTEIDMNN